MRRSFRHGLFLALVLVSVASSACSSASQPSPAGLWNATVVVRDLVVPFKFEISGTGSAVSGHFFDGDVRVPSTGGSFDDGALVLRFDQYGSKIEATLQDGRLDGKYDRGTRGPAYAFRADRAGPEPPADGTVPQIDGEWRILLDKPSSNNEASWRFI